MRAVAFALLFVSSLAHAQYFPGPMPQFFPANPQITVRPDQISAVVYNPYYEPIRCQGYAFGQHMMAPPLQAFMDQVVPPGQNRFVVVGTNPYFTPFTRGWAEINCHFMRWGW